MLTDPLLSTPSTVTASLLSYGGKNPFGLPIWRIVQAQKHIVIRGGEWTDVDANDNPFLFDCNGDRVALPPTVKSRQFGIMQQPLYPVRGWVLEQWFPAAMFGTREWWNSQVHESTKIPLLGPYPHEGEYWMLAGPWKKMPPLQFLKDTIARYEWTMNKRADVDPEIAMRDFVEEQRKAEERELDRYTEEREYAMRHIVQPMMRSTSLAASRYRQEVMRRCGGRSHVAVGGDS